MTKNLVLSLLEQEYDGPDRKARISLDVDLTGPILLIPKHAFSPEMMAGEFGHVKVTNSTRSGLLLILCVLSSVVVLVEPSERALCVSQACSVSV